MRLPPFTALDWLTWSAEMAAQAAVLATALRLPKPRPHVPLFVFALLSELYMRGVEWLYLEGVAVPGVPPVGAARALYHSVQALHTAWPAAVAALAWWVWRGSQRPTAPGARQGEPCGDTSEPLGTGLSSGPDSCSSRAGDREGAPLHGGGSLRVEGPNLRTDGKNVNPQKTSGPELPEPPPGSLSPGNGVVVVSSSATPNNRRRWFARRGILPGLTRANEALGNLRTLPLAVKAILLSWLAINAAIIAAHPLPRGWTQPVLHAFAAACVLAGVVAIVTGWARRYERAAQVAGYLVVVEGVVVLVGPWAGDVFRQWRTVGAGMYAVAFTLLAGRQWWWRRRS